MSFFLIAILQSTHFIGSFRLCFGMTSCCSCNTNLAVSPVQLYGNICPLMCSSAWDFLLSARQGVNVDRTKPQVWVEDQRRWLTAHDRGSGAQWQRGRAISPRQNTRSTLSCGFICIFTCIFIFAAKVCDHVCHIVAFPGTISDWDWFPPSADAPNWLVIIGARANKVRRKHNPLCTKLYYKK